MADLFPSCPPERRIQTPPILSIKQSCPRLPRAFLLVRTGPLVVRATRRDHLHHRRLSHLSYLLFLSGFRRERQAEEVTMDIAAPNLTSH